MSKWVGMLRPLGGNSEGHSLLPIFSGLSDPLNLGEGGLLHRLVCFSLSFTVAETELREGK